ncbi:Alpha/Beta hydrolase protein [Aspergillus egyptiacus]|nr:Alpha/Beta hydrolase protein [Aspergillus egyptiacus]
MVQYAESWLQIEAASGGRPVFQGSVDDIRAMFAGLHEALKPGYPPITDAVRSTDGEAQGVKYRVYNPNPATAPGPLPLGLFMHGGGYLMGNLETEDFLCRAIAEQSRTVVVSVDYRLAPENKHPTQLRDTMVVLEWAYENASKIGADPTRLYTIGTSAGGTLALNAAREIINARSKVPRSSLRGIIAVGPVTLHPDHVPAPYREAYNSYTEFAEGAPALTRKTMTEFFEHAGMAKDDASAFILLNGKNSFAGFPPVHITTSEADPLRDDGVVLGKVLREAGVEVRENQLKGLPHAYWFFNTLPEFPGFLGEVVGGIRWVVG